MSKTCQVEVKVKGPLGLKLAPHEQGTFVLSAGADKAVAVGYLFASVTRPTGEGPLISYYGCPTTLSKLPANG